MKTRIREISSGLTLRTIVTAKAWLISVHCFYVPLKYGIFLKSVKKELVLY